MQIRFAGLPLMVLLAAISSCSSEAGLKPFSSDGCSLFPDASLISENDWCGCCFEHDIAYWQGGTEEQRLAADDALRACVLDKTDNKMLADAMFDGVRLGGSPYFYNWYRWGYGWDYSRKYQSLTPAETEQATQLLDAYFAAGGERVCD